MVYYIKANQKVYQALGDSVKGKRYPFDDGTYLLYERDLLFFGALRDLDLICERIGAVKLTPMEAKAEQRGETLTELPTATDERYQMGADAAKATAEDSPKDDSEPQEEAEQ